ncbi:MAG: response regulator [bacterium]|nr:response regulator [bacterium]
MAKKILLTEDDQFLSSLLGNRLRREGFEVVIAKNGDDALKELGAQKIDLVLLDIILPGKSGFEVLEEIKKDSKIAKIPVVIISNLGQDADVEKGKQLGAVDYIVKARVSIDNVIQKIKDYLG